MYIPNSTYRLQFNSQFTFTSAKDILPYLAELGVSTLYASPIFQARRGSTHGYDVVDPNQINPELGGKEKLDELLQDLQKYNMGWIQDIVPNHMAYDGQNFMLMDILESGQDSDYIDFFDVNWHHLSFGSEDRILAPFLGNFYDACLENAEIQLGFDAAGLHINYYDLRFPLNINSYHDFFTHQLPRLKRKLGRNHPDYVKLLGALYSLKFIPSKKVDLIERADQISFCKQLLWDLYGENSHVQTFIDENLTLFNGQPGDPSSFDLLDHLLSQQNFRLAFWKVGAEEINYRRFFTVNELISLRMEDKEVFRKTHNLIFKMIDQGKFQGLRIDHIDGLYDPIDYLNRLRERVNQSYIIVEKILESHETIPSHWPLQGSTGYDFLVKLNGIFCQTNYWEKFDLIYTTFSGLKVTADQVIEDKKRLIIERNLSGDMDNLAYLHKQISSRHRYANDFTLYSLRKALVEVLIYFPVYRIYVNNGSLDEIGQSYIRQAVEQARESQPILLNELNFIERFLLLQYDDLLAQDEKNQWIHFVMRLQQFAGPLMAKGVEDTAFYVYNRLLSLNEVGGDPRQFGISLDDFHQFNQTRSNDWPLAMNSTSTHDTKRGEDARARLNVLSEIPEEWEAHLKVWREINADHKTRVKGSKRSELPDRNDEYMLYQTLLASFPFIKAEYPTFSERLKAYVIKAVREAKVHTAWLRPDATYETAITHFVEKLLDDSKPNPFLDSFFPFLKKIQHYGIFNSLAQTLIKVMAPGIPDIYQGSEFWDLSMVDPDNRRPVDFDHRLQVLTTINDHLQQSAYADLLADLLTHRIDGRIKLYTLYQALQIRQQYPTLFSSGSYWPLRITGVLADHVIAFARIEGNLAVMCVACRWLTPVIEEGQDPLGRAVWQNTEILLPFGKWQHWHNVLTHQPLSGKDTLALADILESFPVALLISRT
ncbi:MAG: malto-oligosyltrehalose synthase [Cyanobacteriota bacterium]|nr:malto-oligosyltrehalose synthase [Cyanobacteriota bacterium]